MEKQAKKVIKAWESLKGDEKIYNQGNRKLVG